MLAEAVEKDAPSPGIPPAIDRDVVPAQPVIAGKDHVGPLEEAAVPEPTQNAMPASEDKFNNAVRVVPCNEDDKEHHCILRISRAMPQNLNQKQKDAWERKWLFEIRVSTYLGSHPDQAPFAPAVQEAQVYQNRLMMLLKTHGFSLTDIIVRSRPNVDERKVCHEICRLLRRIAIHGIFLADMKPDNIVVDITEHQPENVVKVIDFENAYISFPEWDKALCKCFLQDTDVTKARFIRLLYGASMCFLLYSFIKRYLRLHLVPDSLANSLTVTLSGALAEYAFHLPELEDLLKIEKDLLVESKYFVSLQKILDHYKYFKAEPPKTQLGVFWEYLRKMITLRDKGELPAFNIRGSFRTEFGFQTVPPLKALKMPSKLSGYTISQIEELEQGKNKQDARKRQLVQPGQLGKLKLKK